MEKYSVEWKEKNRKWIQKHLNGWKIHYIAYGTEYSVGDYRTAKEARENLKNF